MRRNSSQLDFLARRQQTQQTRSRRLVCLAGAFLVWLLLSSSLTPGFSGRGKKSPGVPAGCLGYSGSEEGRFHRRKGAYVPPAKEARYRLGERPVLRKHCPSLESVANADESA